MKTIRYLLEFLLIIPFYLVFRLMPIRMASAVMGSIAKKLGPFFGAHKTALRNLKRFIPELSEEERQEAALEVWENLGRTVAEFIHLRKFSAEELFDFVELENKEYLEDMIKQGKSGMMCAGHFANWEVCLRLVDAHQVHFSGVYRPINNYLLDRFILWLRASHYIHPIPKGRQTAKKMVQAIKSGHWVGFLADQKMNEGAAIPFMGEEAMTSTAIVDLALKFNLPILPAQGYRDAKGRLKMRLHKPFYLEQTGDRKKDIYSAMCKINGILETWVREHPGQWFWLHNRWPKK